MPDPIEVKLEPGSLRKLIQASKTWDRASRTEMRKNLREAAAGAVQDTKNSVLSAPPAKADQRGKVARRLGLRARYGTGHRQHTGLRAGLASGVKVSIRSGREASDGTVSGEGVRVAASGSALPGTQQAMVKAYMAKTFRHPVFGRGGWANQHGKSWFYGPLKSRRDEYQAAIVAAIEAAAEAIAKET